MADKQRIIGLVSNSKNKKGHGNDAEREEAEASVSKTDNLDMELGGVSRH